MNIVKSKFIGVALAASTALAACDAPVSQSNRVVQKPTDITFANQKHGIWATVKFQRNDTCQNVTTTFKHGTSAIGNQINVDGGDAILVNQQVAAQHGEAYTGKQGIGIYNNNAKENGYESIKGWGFATDSNGQQDAEVFIYRPDKPAVSATLTFEDVARGDRVYVSWGQGFKVLPIGNINNGTGTVTVDLGDVNGTLMKTIVAMPANEASVTASEFEGISVTQKCLREDTKDEQDDPVIIVTPNNPRGFCIDGCGRVTDRIDDTARGEDRPVDRENGRPSEAGGGDSTGRVRFEAQAMKGALVLDSPKIEAIGGEFARPFVCAAC